MGFQDKFNNFAKQKSDGKINKKMITLGEISRDSFGFSGVSTDERYNEFNEENDYLDYYIILKFSDYPFTEEVKYKTVEERQQSYDLLMVNLEDAGIKFVNR